MLKELPPGAVRLADGTVMLSQNTSGADLIRSNFYKLHRELHTRPPKKSVRLFERMLGRYCKFRKNRNNAGREPAAWSELGKWLSRLDKDYRLGKLPVACENSLREAGHAFNDASTFEGELAAYNEDPAGHRAWAIKIRALSRNNKLTFPQLELLKNAGFILNPDRVLRDDPQKAMEDAAFHRPKPRKPGATRGIDGKQGLSSAEKPFSDLLPKNDEPAIAPSGEYPLHGSAMISDQDAKVFMKAIAEYGGWLADPAHAAPPRHTHGTYERWLAQQYIKINKWGKEGKLTFELELSYLKINPAYNMAGHARARLEKYLDFASGHGKSPSANSKKAEEATLAKWYYYAFYLYKRSIDEGDPSLFPQQLSFFGDHLKGKPGFPPQ